MQKLFRIFIYATLFSLSHKINCAPKQTPLDTCHTPCTQLKEGSITIFIHGTVFPGVSRLMGHHEKRRGLYHYSANPRRLTTRQRLGRALYSVAPDEFPLESFYKFYWSGELTLPARKKAAQELFNLLKDHKGPCTLIAHSHGCNVALHLAEYAEQKDALGNVSPLTIERLILLAPPVQEATTHLVHAPNFKRVYSCYSIADVIQVADPQGITKEMKKGKEKLPLFSKRTYAPGPRLTQAQITFGERNPSHRDFILPPFFGQLPHILKLLDTPQARNSVHVIIEVPFQGHLPHLIEKKQERRMMKAHKPSTKQRRKQ